MSRRSSKKDDTPLGVQIVARIFSALIIVLINSCIRSIWYSAPETGRLVAIASFGEDGVYTHWECQDAQGYYPCNSAKSSDTPESRNHYAIPPQYEVIDTFGGNSTGDKQFLLLNTEIGVYYVADVGFSEAEFKLHTQIEVYPEGKLTSVAERREGDLWYYYTVGDNRVFEYHEGQFSPAPVANGYPFLEAEAFQDSGPTLWCRSPLEDTVKCPEPGSGLENFMRIYPDFWMIAVAVLFLDFLAFEGLARIGISWHKRRKTNLAM